MKNPVFQLFLTITVLCLTACAAHGQEPRTVAELQALLDAAVAEGKTELVIPPGEYRGPGVNGAVVTLNGARDLSIVADGVTIVATTLDRVLYISDCENITLRGLSVDHDPLPFTQGEVIAVADDQTSFDLKVHAGYDADLEYAGRRAVIHDAQTGLVKANTWSRFGVSVTPIGDGVLRVNSGRPMVDALAVGDFATISKPTRSPHGIMIENVRNSTFEDVRVLAATSFAIFEKFGGGNAYLGCRVEPGASPGSEPRLLASNADSFHSKHTDVGPRVEGAHFEAMGDDGIAINGDYALVLANEDGRILIAPRNEPTFQVGDRVHAFNPSGKRTELARITGLEPTQWTGDKPVKDVQLELYPELRYADNQFKTAWALELESPLELEPGDLLSSPDRNGSGFVVRNNTIRNHRARGILIKASNGVIEDNDVEGSSLAGILIVPEVTYWMEADFSSDVVIRNNRIAGVNHGVANPGSVYAGAITIVASAVDGFWPAGGHQHLQVTGNTIEDISGPAIVLTSAVDVQITDNQFIRPGRTSTANGSAHGINPAALLWLNNVRDVLIRDNTVVEPGAYQGPLVETAGTADNIDGLDDGVQHADPQQ